MIIIVNNTYSPPIKSFGYNLCVLLQTLDDIPYIYFGSRSSFDEEDLREIAPGLLWLLLKDDVSKHEEQAAVTYVNSKEYFDVSNS